MELILASKSKARAALLRASGYDFRQIPAVVDETVPRATTLPALVRRLAREKALAVSEDHPDAVIIGSDTALALDGRIMGKAAGREDAVRMLLRLAGRTHRLATGVCVVGPAGSGRRRPIRTAADTALVTLRKWSEAQIRKYVDAVRPFACAGAYELQGQGSAIIERIEGNPSTVVGLPIGLVERFLKELGFRPATTDAD